MLGIIIHIIHDLHRWSDLLWFLNALATCWLIAETTVNRLRVIASELFKQK